MADTVTWQSWEGPLYHMYIRVLQEKQMQWKVFKAKLTLSTSNTMYEKKYHLAAWIHQHMETSFGHTARLTSAQSICKDPQSPQRYRLWDMEHYAVISHSSWYQHIFLARAVVFPLQTAWDSRKNCSKYSFICTLLLKKLERRIFKGIITWSDKGQRTAQAKKKYILTNTTKQNCITLTSIYSLQEKKQKHKIRHTEIHRYEERTP